MYLSLKRPYICQLDDRPIESSDIEPRILQISNQPYDLAFSFQNTNLFQRESECVEDRVFSFVMQYISFGVPVHGGKPPTEEETLFLVTIFDKYRVMQESGCLVSNAWETHDFNPHGHRY